MEGYLNRFDLRAINAIFETIQSPSGYTDKFLGGEQILSFEDEFAEYHGCKWGIAVNSGTSALFTVLHAIMATGENVALPAVGFTADSAMVLANGGVPIYQDIDNLSHCMDSCNLANLALPIHLLGHPCNEEILHRWQDNDVTIIEDCAQACGATYPSGKSVGSIGDASIFSFQETKHITTLGEGGMICTNDEEIAEQCRRIRNHGEYYRHDENIGFNFRMTEAQAAVGRVQLRSLSLTLKTFRDNLDYVIHKLPHNLLPSMIPRGHSMMILACQYRGNDKKAFMERVTEARRREFGYGTSDIKGFNQRPGHIVSDGVRPQYTIPMYAEYTAKCPNADRYCEESIYIDIHRWRSRDEISRELEILNKES